MSKHTPGPWRMYKSMHTDAEVNQHSINGFVDIPGYPGPTECRLADVYMPADAALVAAAPELLEALERLIKQVEAAQNHRVLKPHWALPDMEAARAAIRKAEGV